MNTKTRLITLITVLSTSVALAANKKPAPKYPVKSVQAPYDLFESKPLDEALAHFDSIQKKLKNPKAHVLGDAYLALQAKKTGKARSLAAGVVANPIFSDYAHWIIGLSYQADASFVDEMGKLKPAAGSARSALQHFQTILTEDPYSPFFKIAPKLIGESELLLAYGFSPSQEAVHHFEAAFERLNRAGESSAINGDETASYARACKKNTSELCIPWLVHLTEHLNRNGEQFQSIVQLFPQLEDRAKNTAAASHASQQYHAPDLDFAAFDDAMASYSSEKWDDSSAKFQKFLDEFPKSAFRYRARYWLGLSLQHQKKQDEAKKTFSNLKEDSTLSYYGVLASIADQVPIDSSISSTYPLAAERDVSLSPQETYHLHRGEIFLGEKAPELAGMEFREIKPRPTMSSPFLAYLSGLEFRAQNFPALYGTLTELIQRSYPNIASNIGMQMIFPVVHLDFIKKFSAERSIDPILVLSLIKQESAFDSRAISVSGASGLMQLMYFTALETSPGISHDDLLRPEPNIMTGTRYLAKLLTHYQGNIVLSLAAYNAGPTPVDRWVKDGVKLKLGMLPFIESIPYKETRDYVSSIVRNYIWYSRWYGEKISASQPTTLAYFWKPYGGLNPEVGGPDFGPETAAKLPQAAQPSVTPSPIVSTSPVATPVTTASPLDLAKPSLPAARFIPNTVTQPSASPTAGTASSSPTPSTSLAPTPQPSPSMHH